nr:DJ-1/PfpI family protein [uncultured Pseudomonas sp.]
MPAPPRRQSLTSLQRTHDAFSTRTFTVDGTAVASDLGLIIHPTEALTRLNLVDLDLFVICGGLRTPLQTYPALREAAHIVAECGSALAGLWSGAWFLGEAGLLNGYRCAIHPEHRAALSELAKDCVVTNDSFTVTEDRLTAASRDFRRHAARHAGPPVRSG